MAKLLACPFCGGAAERLDIEDGENAGGSCIACTVCQASSNVEFEFKENFVSNWNRRDAERELLEALKLLLADVADYPAWERPCHAVDVARSAIAKATGEAP